LTPGFGGIVSLSFIEAKKIEDLLFHTGYLAGSGNTKNNGKPTILCLLSDI
jgi:hypothetical protein